MSDIYHNGEMYTQKKKADKKFKQLEAERDALQAKLDLMSDGKPDTVCNDCNRQQNLNEMLRVKKTKTSYKIVCRFCGSDKINPLTDKVNE